MTAVGLLDRLMRRSVDRALDMQPKRVRAVADEVRFAAPSAREEVAAVADAARRLVAGRLALPTLGRVAVRRTDRVAVVTAPGADLSDLTGASMTTVHLDGDDATEPLLVPIRAGSGAAVLGQPVALLALAGSDPVLADLPALAGVAGPVTWGGVPSGPGVGVDPAWGAVAAGHDPAEAVTRLEAAERLAEITIERREHR